MNQRFEQTAFYPADILLPQTAEMKKWPVVACDQFTSQPDYWQAAEAAVGEAPSALRLVLPEVYLNGPDVDKRIETINASMDRCLAEALFRTLSDSLIYLERTQSDGRVRHGLIGCVDLEQYDFTPGSGALIRATEGTVLERIPPRVRVREHAALELPHVMLLIDDPRGSVIEPLAGETGVMEALYDKVTPPERWASLPARYALVEVVNLHDDALTFEPIHRVLFHVDGRDLWEAFQAFYPGAHTGGGEGHTAEVCGQGMDGLWTVPHPKAQLTVGTLQAFLDAYCRDHPEVQVDYIHGDDVARKLGSQPGNLSFLLPLMGKEQLFPTVMADGVLPRKTFSMGEARDKRYYLEARRIR